jgi:RND family efflux transporter MFP subunit
MTNDESQISNLITMHPVFPISVLAALLATSSGRLAAEEPPTVSTVFPVPATGAAAFELPGRTEPIEQATVFSRATGMVRERRFDIGDRVKSGEVLAVIDAPELDRAVESAKALADQAASRANNARQIAERADGLLKARAISQEDFDLRITTAETANAALRVAQAEQARAEQWRAFTIVTAPFSGTVTARNADRGDRVRGDSSTAEGWLYRLSRLETLRFVIHATPDVALRIKETTEATVRFNELPGTPFRAKLARSSGVFETSTGTMRVECLIENPDLRLPAGLTGTAAFELPPAPGTFTLPNNCLVLRQGKPLIATVRDGTVRFTSVQPGRNLGQRIEITSAALSPQSEVIVNPNAMLREGDPVKSVPAPAKGNG